MNSHAWRASDEQRTRTVEQLQQATVDGCLTLEEFEDRVGRAYGARYLSDLDRLLADLPQAQRPRVPASTFSRRGPAAPFPTRRFMLRLLALGLIITLGVHLWLPLLIVSFIAWRCGWRPHRLRYRYHLRSKPPEFV